MFKAHPLALRSYVAIDAKQRWTSGALYALVVLVLARLWSGLALVAAAEVAAAARRTITMTDIITETQRELLARAANVPEDAIDAADAKAAKALVKKGLAISLPIDGGASRLIITEAGRAVIAEQPQETGTGDPGTVDQTRAGAIEELIAAQAPTEAPKPKKDAPGGKLGVLVGLLKRPGGATLPAMTAATGWQAHSVRGAMSGSLKKGFGFAISSEKTDAGRVYKIADGEPLAQAAGAEA